MTRGRAEGTDRVTGRLFRLVEECRDGPELRKLLREELPENEDRLPEDLEDEDLEDEDLELEDLEPEDLLEEREELCDELDEWELELRPLGGITNPPLS